MASALEFVKTLGQPRRYGATVIFVHHFGGSRASVKRHQALVSQLGFDSVAFTLDSRNPAPWGRLPLIHRLAPGTRKKWEDEIADVLNNISGPKILYSFSFPSAPAIEAFSQIPKEEQVAWICDGGPFFHLAACMWNYYTHQEPTKLLPWRATKAIMGMQSMDFLTLERDVGLAIQRLPSRFPVLSVRYWQDQLVPIAAIDAVFRGHDHLNLETLSLPEAPHIGGLSAEPATYKARVSQFLLKVSEPYQLSESSSSTSDGAKSHNDL